jgi:hypothetical protein
MQHIRVRAMTRVRSQDNIVHEWSGLYIHADCCFNDLTIQDPFWYLRPVKKKPRINVIISKRNLFSEVNAHLTLQTMVHVL